MGKDVEQGAPHRSDAARGLPPREERKGVTQPVGAEGRAKGPQPPLPQ